MATSLAETQMRTIQAFIDGRNEWAPGSITRGRASDCVHQILPASMGYPPTNNEQDAAFAKMLIPNLTNHKFEPIKIINAPEQHAAVLHAKAFANTPVGDYKNEYIYMFEFNEDGTEIKRIDEMIDSGMAKELFPKLMAHMGQQGAAANGK